MSLDQFFEPEDHPYSDIICTETRKRIKLCIAAYAYEYLGQPTMTDAAFDSLAKEIDLSITTRRPDMDEWFKKHFTPHTGMWIHKHPEKDRLDFLAKMILEHRKNNYEA